jgi:hypothetical protein
MRFSPFDKGFVKKFMCKWSKYRQSSMWSLKFQGGERLESTRWGVCVIAKRKTD